MLAQFGIEASRAAQYVVAFAIILVLVALFGVVLRKLTGARLMMPGQDRTRNRQPRLGVVDIYDLDRQRQLVLLRRDNVEHLLLIGGLNDVVIETNIVRVAGARVVPPADTAPERLEPAFEPAPRPQVEGTPRPSIESQLAAQINAVPRRPSEESDIEQELAPVASISAALPLRPEPPLRHDVGTAAVPGNGAPGIHGLRAEARAGDKPHAPPSPGAPPPVAPPQSETASILRGPLFVPRTAPPSPPVAAPSPPTILRSFPPATTERTPPAPDAAILSDMAKQLEEALKRPATPVAVSAMPVPETQAADDPGEDSVEDRSDNLGRDFRHELAGPPSPMADEDDILEPAVSVPVQGTQGASAPLSPPADEDQIEEAVPAAPAPKDRGEGTRAAGEPEGRPGPVPFGPAAPGTATSASASGPAAPKAPDPFSVEEIEAEFARLLGRPLDGAKKE